MTNKSKKTAIKKLVLKILMFISILPFLGGCAHIPKKGKMLGESHSPKASTFYTTAFVLEEPKTSNFRAVSLGMDKQQVVKQLGEPKIVCGAVKNNVGQVIEKWEYAADEYDSYTYSFYFCDNKLIQWGNPGNWNVEEKADNISEIRVR